MNEQEREAFEAWHRQDLLDMPVHQDPKERQFRTWQARAALAAKVPAECERLREHAVTLANTTYLTTLELCAKVCDAHFNHEAKDCAEEIRALANAATPAPAPEAAELAKAHEARRQAQSEVAYLKARLSGARLILMRELKEQGWTPPAPAQAQQADDLAVDSFAQAMKEKLAAAREKGRAGWQTCPPEELSLMLREHVEKGDPRDVANFCMFLWSLGEAIQLPPVGTEVFDLWVKRGMGQAPAQAQQSGSLHAAALQAIAALERLDSNAGAERFAAANALRSAVEAKPEAQPLTAMQARSVVDGMGWALDEVEIEDMEMLVKAAERACAEAWGVKLGASGEK